MCVIGDSRVVVRTSRIVALSMMEDSIVLQCPPTPFNTNNPATVCVAPNGSQSIRPVDANPHRTGLVCQLVLDSLRHSTGNGGQRALGCMTWDDEFDVSVFDWFHY